MELAGLYEGMCRARAFEEALEDLWNRGLVSGEMHLGTGEEAVAAGVAAHVEDGDALALDHRCTPMLVLVGVDMTSMLKEVMGRQDGLCRGMAGHMHLMSRDHLAAASGIVGASGPMAAGFGLSATRLRRGSVALAFHGEGAANQGMMMESMNLAAAWKLPVVFVCKDNGWAVTTRSRSVTGGDLVERARAFGLAAWDVDGLEVTAVDEAAGEAIAHARRGKGPGFIRATCSRLDGHFLGDLLVRAARGSDPEGSQELGKIVRSLASRGGASILSRTRSMGHMMDLMRRARKETRGSRIDPVVRARRRLGKEEAAAIEARVAAQVAAALEAAIGEGG